MTCRHMPGDPNCSSSPSYYRTYSETNLITPDSEKFEIIDVEVVGFNLVMKVKYPNCSACSYEGNKVMVFRNTTPIDALKWKKIDPHFRDPKKPANPREAPSPAARFPATAEGWKDAVSYASSLQQVR